VLTSSSDSAPGARMEGLTVRRGCFPTSQTSAAGTIYAVWNFGSSEQPKPKPKPTSTTHVDEYAATTPHTTNSLRRPRPFIGPRTTTTTTKTSSSTSTSTLPPPSLPRPQVCRPVAIPPLRRHISSTVLQVLQRQMVYLLNWTWLWIHLAEFVSNLSINVE